ncbi:MAG: lysylphosphatidylglycerol synthase transmembrane domain-containing protein [Chitinivibrionales bacterium]
MNIQQIFKSLNNNRLLWPFKMAITALVVYLVYKSLGNGQLPLLLHPITLRPLIVSLILGCVGFYLQTRRWQLLLGNQGTRISFRTGLRTMLWGCLLAFVTPGRFGEFFRGISIKPENKANAVYAVIIEKIYAGGTALVAGACGATFSWWAFGALSPAQGSIIICCSAVMAAVLGIFFSKRILRNAFARFFRSRAPQNMAAFPFANLTKKAAAPIAFLSIATHLVLLFQTAVLLDMFGSHGARANISIAAQAYAFMLFFPVFIANMGIREYSFGLFLGKVSVVCGLKAQVSAIAIGASMGILCINMILPAVAGLLWWIMDRKKLPVAGEQFPERKQ